MKQNVLIHSKMSCFIHNLSFAGTFNVCHILESYSENEGENEGESEGENEKGNRETGRER